MIGGFDMKKFLLWSMLVAVCSVFWFGVYALVAPSTAQCDIFTGCANSPCLSRANCFSGCVRLRGDVQSSHGRCVKIS